MLRHACSTIAAITLGLVVTAAGTAARAQFQAPPRSLALEEKGKFEEIQNDVIQIRDLKNEAWWLQLSEQTKVSVEGEADPECLRTGVFVRFTAEIDKKGSLTEPLDEIEIISAQGKMSLGLFSPTENADEEEPKPERKAGAGKYIVRGKITLFKNGEIIVVAGNRRVMGEVAEKLTVSVDLDDPTIAQFGDEVNVKAWYYDPNRPQPLLNRPGKALAEEITIKLSKPMAPSGKKSRAPEKSSRQSAKSAAKS